MAKKTRAYVYVDTPTGLKKEPLYPIDAVTATPNTVILRDVNGRSQVNDPVAEKDIMNLQSLNSDALTRLLNTIPQYSGPVDLNDFKTSGASRFLGNALNLNHPYTAGYSYLFVNAANPNRIVQTLLAVQVNEVWNRVCTDNVWTSWVCLTGTVAPTANRSVLRDASGRSQINDPVDQLDIVNYRTLSSVAPIKLTAHTSFYVNAATGNNSTADGTSAKPFKTIQACLNFISMYRNLGEFNADVQVAAGRYAGFIAPKYTSGNGVVCIIGAGKDLTFIDHINKNAAAIVLQLNCGRYYLRHMTVNTEITDITNPSFTFTGCIDLVQGSFCEISNMNFTIVENALVPLSVFALRVFTGQIVIQDNISIQVNGSVPQNQSKVSVLTASGAMTYNATAGNPLNLSGRAATIMVCNDSGRFYRQNQATPLITGTMNAKRYTVSTHGWVSTGGGGENYFPGDIAGTVNTSQYGLYT